VKTFPVVARNPYKSLLVHYENIVLARAKCYLLTQPLFNKIEFVNRYSYLGGSSYSGDGLGGNGRGSVIDTGENGAGSRGGSAGNEESWGVGSEGNGGGNEVNANWPKIDIHTV